MFFAMMRYINWHLQLHLPTTTHLDDLVEQTAHQSVETGSGAAAAILVVFGHVQDGGEAGRQTVDEGRYTFRVARQPSQRLQRLDALVLRHLV